MLAGLFLLVISSRIALPRHHNEPQATFIPVVEASSPRPQKTGGSEAQQEMIKFAYEISPDMNWIYTIEAESGWILDRRSPTNDWGLCQLHYPYHKNFIKSPEFKNYKNQLLYCAEIYKRASEKGILGRVFFGYNVRNKAIKNFTIK